MEVVWSAIALDSLSDVMDYTYENFGEKQCEVIRETILASVKLLSIFPYSAPIEENLSDENRIYRCKVVTKEIKVLYTVRNDEILLVELIWNVRQDLSTIIERLV